MCYAHTLLLLLVINTVPVGAVRCQTPYPPEPSPLRDLTAVFASSQYVADELEKQGVLDGQLYRAIQDTLETRLTSAGIRILGDKQWEATAGRPSVFLKAKVKMLPE